MGTRTPPGYWIILSKFGGCCGPKPPPNTHPLTPNLQRPSRQGHILSNLSTVCSSVCVIFLLLHVSMFLLSGILPLHVPTCLRVDRFTLNCSTLSFSFSTCWLFYLHFPIIPLRLYLLCLFTFLWSEVSILLLVLYIFRLFHLPCFLRLSDCYTFSLVALMLFSFSLFLRVCFLHTVCVNFPNVWCWSTCFYFPRFGIGHFSTWPSFNLLYLQMSQFSRNMLILYLLIVCIISTSSREIDKYFVEKQETISVERRKWSCDTHIQISKHIEKQSHHTSSFRKVYNQKHINIKYVADN